MDPKLEQAIQAIKTGDKAAGLVLLAQFIRTDPSNETAWIWMATAQDDPEKKKQCLERVLRINPANERVRRAIATMFPAPVQPEAAPATVEAAPQAEPVIVEQLEVHKEELAEEVVPAIVSETPEAFEPAPAPVEIPQEAAAQVESAVEAAAPQIESPVEAAAPQIESAPQLVAPFTHEAALPDLSWLKDTTSSPVAPKEEAADLSWLKVDLPAESLAEEGLKESEAAQPELAEPALLKEDGSPVEHEVKKEQPALDLSWLKEDQPAAEGEATSFVWPDETKAQEAGVEPFWQNEEQSPAQAEETGAAISPTPTAETGDLSWLPTASTSPFGQPAATPAESEEPDFSWLRSEPSSEQESPEQPLSEAVFPWLHEEPGPAEAPAVMNDAEAIPDWLRQGADRTSETSISASSEAVPAASEPASSEAAEQEPAPVETGPLTPEDFDAITSKRAELPFSWNEVTGEPVVKSPEKAATAPFAAAPGDQTSQPFAASVASARKIPAAPSAFASAPISTPSTVAKSAQKKGLTGGQIVLLSLFGLVCLIAVLAVGIIFAINAGWLKAFGF
jgi:hypothetical protein